MPKKKIKKQTEKPKKKLNKKTKKVSFQEYIPMGGMALSNGIMLRSYNYMAIAMTDEVGKIEVLSFKLKNIREKYSLLFIPFIRGITYFIENLVFLIKAMWHKRAFVKNLLRRKTRAQRLFIKIDQYILYIIYLLLVVGFFNYLYGNITHGLSSEGVTFCYNFLITLGLILFFAVLFALVTIGRKRDYQYFAYHSVEHRIINMHERHTRKDNDISIYNDRCGLVVGFWVAVFLSLLVTFLKIPEYGVIWGGLVVIGLFLLSSSLAYEFVMLLSKIEGSIFNFIFIKPINLVQYFFLSNPSDINIAVGQAALDEIVRLEKASK